LGRRRALSRRIERETLMDERGGGWNQLRQKRIFRTYFFWGEARPAQAVIGAEDDIGRIGSG